MDNAMLLLVRRTTVDQRMTRSRRLTCDSWPRFVNGGMMLECSVIIIGAGERANQSLNASRVLTICVTTKASRRVARVIQPDQVWWNIRIA